MPAWFKSEINIRKLSTLIGEVFLQNLSIKKQNGYIQIFKSLLKTKNAMNVFQTTPVLIFWQFKGTWVIEGGIEMPCKYLIYADKKLKSKIRTMLRKVSM